MLVFRGSYVPCFEKLLTSDSFFLSRQSFHPPRLSAHPTNFSIKKPAILRVSTDDVGGWFLKSKRSMEVNETSLFVTFGPINFGIIFFPMKYFRQNIHLLFLVGLLTGETFGYKKNTRIYKNVLPWISSFTASQPTIIVQWNNDPWKHWTINDFWESTSQQVFDRFDFKILILIKNSHLSRNPPPPKKWSSLPLQPLFDLPSDIVTKGQTLRP